MAVSYEVIKKIDEYQRQGYTPDEIVTGLSQSQNFKDVASKVKFYQAKGYGADEILGGIRESSKQLASEHPLSGDIPQARMRAMNPEQQVNEDGTRTPEWAGKAPTLYGLYGVGKAVAPLAAGAGAGMISPALAPAGFALGGAGIKTLETAMGEREVRPMAENFKDVAKDYAVTALTQGIADKAIAAGKAGYGLIKKVPAVTEKAAERKAGEILKENTSENPVYAQNADEAAQLEKGVEGLKFTRGQKTGDPLAIKQERSLSAEGLTTSKDVEQRASGSEAIRNFFEKNFPDAEGVDDVIAALESRKADIAGNLKNAKGEVGREAQRLGAGADAQESGQVIKQSLQTAKDSARAKAKELYDAVPDVKLATDELDTAIKNLSQDFQKSGDSFKDFPKGIAKQIQERIKPIEAESKLLDAKGRPIKSTEVPKPQDIGFQELRGFRTQIREALQDAERGANPNYKLARRLKMLQDSVEKTIGKMEGAGGEAAKSFRDASAYYRQYDKAFRKGAVAEVLRPGTQAEGGRVASAEIAGKFFKAGKPDAADDFLRAIGDNAKAKQAIKDYAAHDLLRNAENPATGELVNSKVFSWYAKNRPMLDKFGLTGEFNNIVKAQKSVDAFKGLSEAFDKTAASKLLGSDSEKAIKAAFTGKGGTNTSETMRELMGMVKGDNAAESGLKKAFAEHIMKEMETTGLDVLNNPVVSVAKGKKILAKYGPAIRELYKNEPQKIKALSTIQRAYEVLGRNAKSPIGGGSDTTEKFMEVLAQDVSKRTEALPVVGRILKILNSYERQQVRAVMAKAVFDPDYAETLIMAVKGAPSDVIKKRMNTHIAAMGVMGGKQITNNNKE